MENNPLRILVVDDDATVRMLNCFVLQSLGYSGVQTAEDGQKAMALMQEQKFDVVISDINMPNMSGYGLLMAMSAGGYLATTPTIMVTSESRAEDIRLAKTLGASSYILKPLGKESLRRALQDIFVK